MTGAADPDRGPGPGVTTGRAALALARPDAGLRPLLVVSDFDGTVSRLVMDPWAATIIPAARRALRRLAGLDGVHVALLSGRTAGDVSARSRVGGALYLGNHGLERGSLPRRGRAERLVALVDPAHDPFLDDAERLAVAVAAAVPEPWLVVERKGPAVAFHYRAAPDVPAAAALVATAVDAHDPGGRFERFAGRRILELRPPGAIAKGGALGAILRETGARSAFVLGDDRSDAEAFRVLRGEREAGRVRGLAIAVRAHAEVQPDVAEAADVVLASPGESAAFLTGLARLASTAGSVEPTR